MRNGMTVAMSILLAGILCFWPSAFTQAQEAAQDAMTSSELSSFSTGSGYAGTQGLHGAAVTGNILEEVDRHTTSEILGSGNDNTGIVNVNQSSGDMNAQLNFRVLAVATGSDGLNEIQLGTSAYIGENWIRSTGGSRLDLIEGSFQNSNGIIGINQSAGNMNIQSNALVLVIGGVANLSEMELGQVTASNGAEYEATGDRMDIIRDSFANTHGIVQVTQSAGDMNMLGNNLAFSYTEVHLK